MTENSRYKRAIATAVETDASAFAGRHSAAVGSAHAQFQPLNKGQRSSVGVI